ncbi:hypothetical protein, partial [Vibrio parahaemolyticus]|uniref:hypothetical protein n=3 Tax=Vibrio parahaemolyticus TaxID=670 RepID=UPI001EDB8CD0
ANCSERLMSFCAFTSSARVGVTDCGLGFFFTTGATVSGKAFGEGVEATVLGAVCLAGTEMDGGVLN